MEIITLATAGVYTVLPGAASAGMAETLTDNHARVARTIEILAADSATEPSVRADLDYLDVAQRHLQEAGAD